MEMPDSETLIKRFYSFFEEFKKKEIKKAYYDGLSSLKICFFELSEYDFELADILLAYPEDVISIMEATLEQFKESESSNKLKVRLVSLPSTEKVMIRDIRSQHLGKLVLLEGIVRRKTDVRPRLTHLEYLCTNPSCTYSQEIIRVPQIEEKTKTLKSCPKCKSPVELTNKMLVDSQNLVMEELTEQLKNSADQPKRINIMLQEDLVSPFKDSKTNPGSRVDVIGIVKEVPIPTRTGAESTNYDLLVEGNYIERSEQDFSEVVITKEEEEQIKEIASQDNVMKTLVDNMAPSIYGYTNIKESILLQQFGGTGGTKGDGIKTRGDIHILLIGDPGAAKSQLLKAATAIAPKASFVSGKSASGVGLTASIVRDDFTKGWALEAGAIVLASGGLCCTTGDSFFITENLEKVRFDELFGDSEGECVKYPKFRVLGLNENTLKIEPFEIEHAFKIRNDKKIYKLKTRTGRELNLTYDNEVYTIKDSTPQWREIENLCVGDYIAVPKKYDNLCEKKTNYSKEISLDILWDKIVQFEEISDEYVYDFKMKGTNNFVANDIIMHNCIDELDKMSDEDTSAMHEALEQQCYHYDFELTFADGSTQKIGDYVEKYFEKYSSKVISGVDCEILNMGGERVLTTDFNKIYPIRPKRISRHVAPSHYYKISFSNGRTITVTPEHPLFVYKNNKIETISAALAKKEMIVPAPRKLPLKLGLQKLKKVNLDHHNNKKIDFPRVLDEYLAKFLGYFVSEGHSYRSYKNRYAEIGISNCDESIVDDVEQLFERLFNTTSNINIAKFQNRERATQDLYTVRCTSIPLYKYFQENFPEVLFKAPQKRVPQLIKKSPDEIKMVFLEKFFAGDGFIDSERLGMSTSSYKLAKDLQDMLLSLQIWTYIAKEKRESKIYYKVVVSGEESIDKFINNVAKSDKRISRLKQFLQRSKNRKNARDCVPYEFLISFNEFLKKLHVSDGYFTGLISRKQNSHRDVLLKYLEKAKKKLQSKPDLVLQRMADDFEKFLKSDMKYIKITNVEKVKNTQDKWTYDVTIEPHHSFISEGLVLHNSVSIAKANIRATLRCETTVLGAANPKLGRFDPYGDIPKQIDFPPALLSRFDLIFILRDLPDKKRDDLIANHILQTHKDKSKTEKALSTDFMKKYIAYARKMKPGLTQEAIEKLKSFYISIRNSFDDEEAGAKSMPITARQLEGIVRLAEGYAKAELSTEVKEGHAKRAIDMMMYCLEKIGVDPKTGEMDIDRITTGVTTKSRSSYWRVLDIIKKLAEENPNVEHDAILEKAEAVNMDKTEVEKSLEELKKDSLIMEPRRNIYMLLD